MSRSLTIRTNKEILAKKVKVCDSISSRIKGLMFSKKLTPNKGILLVVNQESINQTSIHSFFVFYTFDVLWLNKEKIVVDKKTVKPFIPLITPRRSAKYVLELSKGSTKEIPIGTKLFF